METMKAAFMLKDSSSLSVRRASLSALYAAFESWLFLKKRRKETPSRGFGAVQFLGDVTGQLDRSGGQGQTSAGEKDEYVLVAAIVDWAVLSSKQDPDETCRAMKVEVIRFAIEAFGLLEGEQ
jgi:hypothetical protein